MHILMFGWEYPPHISGGLGTATYGIIKGLAATGEDMHITLVLPRTYGDEPETKGVTLINASTVDIPGRGRVPFSGTYAGNLLDEIYALRDVAAALFASGTLRPDDFDLVHCHDWLTYPVGEMLKQHYGMRVAVHVHATDYDRSRGQVNPTVYGIERSGMNNADLVLCVSNLTRQTVIEHYVTPDKISDVKTLHNAVDVRPDALRFNKHLAFDNPPPPEWLDSLRNGLPEGNVPVSSLLPEGARVVYPRRERLVTFLGRITMQKGPEFFVETAARVLAVRRDVRFVMAGGGDKMDEMIMLAARLGICDRFHFLGFLRGDDVYRLLGSSDIYIMPSVSEPFGISPLEAMSVGGVVILSNQSGCSELLCNVLCCDYWDVRSMSESILSLLSPCVVESRDEKRPNAIYDSLSVRGMCEVNGITWSRVGEKLKKIYLSKM